jgi:hypothetical protein
MLPEPVVTWLVTGPGLTGMCKQVLRTAYHLLRAAPEAMQRGRPQSPPAATPPRRHRQAAPLPGVDDHDHQAAVTGAAKDPAVPGNPDPRDTGILAPAAAGHPPFRRQSPDTLWDRPHKLTQRRRDEPKPIPQAHTATTSRRRTNRPIFLSRPATDRNVRFCRIADVCNRIIMRWSVCALVVLRLGCNYAAISCLVLSCIREQALPIPYVEDSANR